MSLTTLQRTVVDALEDIKALDIQVYDTRELSDLFDRVIVASATSNRQTRALASHLREKVKAKGFDVVATEGEDTGEWVLVDLGDIIVHIMQPAIRTYYNLEELWGRKPVRVRLGGAAAGATRVAAPASAPTSASKRAAPKAPAKAPAKASAKAPAKASAKAPATRTPAAKAPARRRSATAAPSTPRGKSRGATDAGG
ncbi:MAG: ribosome silencing factor [Lautropia sp.]